VAKPLIAVVVRPAIAVVLQLPLMIDIKSPHGKKIENDTIGNHLRCWGKLMKGA
jgi:hypothetical protein